MRDLLTKIRQAGTNAKWDAANVKESVRLPHPDDLEAIMVNGSARKGFGTLPVKINEGGGVRAIEIWPTTYSKLERVWKPASRQFWT